MIEQYAVGIDFVQIIGIAHAGKIKIFTPDKISAILAVLPALVRMTVHIQGRLICIQHT